MFSRFNFKGDVSQMKSLEEIVIPLGLLPSKFLVVKKASFNCTVATLAGVSIAKILD